MAVVRRKRLSEGLVLLQQMKTSVGFVALVEFEPDNITDGGVCLMNEESRDTDKSIYQGETKSTFSVTSPNSARAG